MYVRFACYGRREGPRVIAFMRSRLPSPAQPGGMGLNLTAIVLAVYLMTGGGHGYSIDGAFAFEMAKTAFLDPDHQYFTRFKTAFARWGIGLPIIGQPFILAGAALGAVAPERDELTVDGHRFRVEEWPSVTAGKTETFPVPSSISPGSPVTTFKIISFLANTVAVPDGTTVAELRLVTATNTVAIPIRAGIETAEWAWDRPDIRGTVAHSRASVAGHWIGQPRGNLYVASLPVPVPVAIDRWEITGSSGLGQAGAFSLRAVAIGTSKPPNIAPVTAGAPPPVTWHDARTGERFWSERQTGDFFAHLGFSVTNAVVTAATVWALHRITLNFGYRPMVALIVGAAFGLGTLAWPYAKYDFAEPTASLALALAVLAIHRIFPPNIGPSTKTPSPGGPTLIPPTPPPALVGFADPLSPRRNVRLMAYTTMLALIFAIGAKYTAILGGIAVITELLISSQPWRRDRRSDFLIFSGIVALPGVAVATAAIGVGLWSTGETPIVLTSDLSRLTSDWLSLPFWIGFRGLVFSSGKSLFLYAPWLLLAIPGSVLWVWRHRFSGSALTVVFPIVTILLYSMKLVWHGGSWGPRYLLMTVPWLTLATAPVIDILITRRFGRVVLSALATVSVAIQVIAIAKHPEQYPAMVRRHVVPTMTQFGAPYGGQDYWDAREGDRLVLALRDPDAETGRSRSLGYLWGLPDASVTITAHDSEAPILRDVNLSLYVIDWDRQGRTETMTITDAIDTRRIELDKGLDEGVWVRAVIRIDPANPVTVAVRQTGPDTAVVSAMAFDPISPGIAGSSREVRLDRHTRGEWPGTYGRDGYAFFGFRSFNIDQAKLPPYVKGYELRHVGDREHPTIHVEVPEDDLLDTAMLYAPPFSPILGNIWLLGADVFHLVIPSRPDFTQGVLLRPPWSWFGISAPLPPHPEYGLGLDFWPSMIWTSHASHTGVVVVSGIVLLGLQVVILTCTNQLLKALSEADIHQGAPGSEAKESEASIDQAGLGSEARASEASIDQAGLGSEARGVVRRSRLTAIGVLAGILMIFDWLQVQG